MVSYTYAGLETLSLFYLSVNIQYYALLRRQEKTGRLLSGSCEKMKVASKYLSDSVRSHSAPDDPAIYL